MIRKRYNFSYKYAHFRVVLIEEHRNIENYTVCVQVRANIHGYLDPIAKWEDLERYNWDNYLRLSDVRPALKLYGVRKIFECYHTYDSLASAMIMYEKLKALTIKRFKL